LYDRKIKRGLEYKFMWLDASIETNWAKLFEFEGDTPKLYFFNPGKRKRFMVHEGENNLDAYKVSFEKVNGGDAKFVKVKDELPEFAFRKE